MSTKEVKTFLEDLFNSYPNLFKEISQKIGWRNPVLPDLNNKQSFHFKRVEKTKAISSVEVYGDDLRLEIIPKGDIKSIRVFIMAIAGYSRGLVVVERLNGALSLSTQLKDEPSDIWAWR